MGRKSSSYTFVQGLLFRIRRDSNLAGSRPNQSISALACCCELCNYQLAMTETPLSSLLAEHGLRYVDLARGCSVDKSTVTRWAENGVPLGGNEETTVPVAGCK